MFSLRNQRSLCNKLVRLATKNVSTSVYSFKFLNQMSQSLLVVSIWMHLTRVEVLARVKHPSLLRQQIFYATNSFIEPRADQFPLETNYVRLLYDAALVLLLLCCTTIILATFLTFEGKSFCKSQMR
jgi:hypothetical protein